MKKIALTQGKFALVDNEDYEYLNQYKWCFGSKRYAMSRWEDKKLIYMHRLIVNTPKGMHTDHINHNRLDNRRENLRVCTPSQNHMNRNKSANFSSIYKGVSWGKQIKKWRTVIKFNYKQIFIGLFDSELQAAMAYDINAKALFGEFTKLNFKGKEIYA